MSQIGYNALKKNESFIMSSNQITMVCLDQLVSAKHQYPKFKDLFDFTSASEKLKSLEYPANYKG